MASSKNNRKKGRKRQPMHSRPIPKVVADAQQQMREEEEKTSRRIQTVSLVGTIVMVVGFIMAIAWSKVIGYPVTFAGAFLTMVTTPSGIKHRNIVIIGYLVYCVMVAFLWASELFR